MLSASGFGSVSFSEGHPPSCNHTTATFRQRGTRPLTHGSVSYFSFRNKPGQKLRRQDAQPWGGSPRSPGWEGVGQARPPSLVCSGSVFGASSFLSIKSRLQIKRIRRSVMRLPLGLGFSVFEHVIYCDPPPRWVPSEKTWAVNAAARCIPPQHVLASNILTQKLQIQVGTPHLFFLNTHRKQL